MYGQDVPTSQMRKLWLREGIRVTIRMGVVTAHLFSVRYILWAGNVVLLSTADAVMERLGQDVTAEWTMSPEQHGGKCGRGEERACEPAMVSQQRQG